MSIENYKQQWAKQRAMEEQAIQQAQASQSPFANEGVSEDALLSAVEQLDSQARNQQQELPQVQMQEYQFSNDMPMPEEAGPLNFGGSAFAGGGSPLTGSYFDKMASVESGGSYTAENPNSGAYGRYQFLRSTAEPMLKKYGATWEDFKRSPRLQDKLAQEFTANNAKILRSNGIPVNDKTLYMAHQLGPGNVLKAFKGGEVNQKHLKANNVSSVNEWMQKFGSRF